jgi:hypothetical protein
MEVLMDGKRFDDTAKALSKSRRAALASGAALILGATLTAHSPQPARARKRQPRPAYTCPPPPNTILTGDTDIRFAQSFLATRSGTLRQIKVAISKVEGTPGDYVVQLVKMTGSGPSNSPLDVLAAATVPNAQVKTGDTTLVASFATTKLAKNTPYAVVVSRPGTTDLTLPIKQGGTACVGNGYNASGSEAFTQITAPAADFIVTVLVL